MSIFAKLVVATLPLVPKIILGKVASQYIAGETLADAVRTVQALNRKQLMATVDVLGEFVHERSVAERDAEVFRHVGLSSFRKYEEPGQLND
jgi:proline dehydrogenase